MAFALYGFGAQAAADPCEELGPRVEPRRDWWALWRNLAWVAIISIVVADLVGFTALGEELPPGQLEQLANRLAELGHDVAKPPVRFIKTIGDAVMFVSTEPAALLDAVLALLDAAAADEALPRLRVGLAYGSAVSRAGDWFGSPVNLASRVTSVARPGAVLVSGPARDEIGDEPRFRWSSAGTKRFKGIGGEVKVYRARRNEQSA
jgi:adenylate cyclase